MDTGIAALYFIVMSKAIEPERGVVASADLRLADLIDAMEALARGTDKPESQPTNEVQRRLREDPDAVFASLNDQDFWSLVRALPPLDLDEQPAETIRKGREERGAQLP
ncbi:MAG TPA: hypothetical protein VEZ11_13915 [Thermoanaerobaculia bacterium]|nr:hypothetical protein [Thermoanaerobaculia bacterium]